MNDVNENLIKAVKTGNQEDTQKLLGHPDCDAKLTSSEGLTPLMLAAGDGHGACVQLLLPLSDAKRVDNAGMTALMWAARGGHTACLQSLLFVSDALAQDTHGLTALMWAAGSGHTSCVQSLLPVSNALATDIKGRTASLLAATYLQVATGQLIDAYVLAMSELALLQSSTSLPTSDQVRLLRV